MAAIKDIDWIFFDVGGVLADDAEFEKVRDRMVIEAVAGLRPALTPEELTAARSKASGTVGHLTENMIAALVDDSVMRISAQSRVKELQKKFPPYSSLSRIRPEAGRVLAALARHYRLGIMANQPKSTKERLTAAGIVGLFSQSGMSHDYGFHKPDRRLYEAVLAETGARPSRSVMVDDNYERGLRTAKSLGLKTVWFTEGGAGLPVPDADPDWRISRFEELADIFA